MHGQGSEDLQNETVIRSAKKMKFAYTDVRSIAIHDFNVWSGDPLCPWCNVICAETYHQFDPPPPRTMDRVHTHVYECAKCGWWGASQYSEMGFGFGNGETSSVNTDRRRVTAILKRFDPASNSACIDELRRYLTYNYSDIRAISPRKMEDLVRDVFKNHLNCDVHYFTNNIYSPDGGIDLVAVESEEGIKTAIQVKRRARNVSESVANVREFVGAMAIEGFQKGIFVSTGKFSKVAQDLPNRIKQVFGDRCELDLIDAAGFEALLRRTQSVEHWHPWQTGIDQFCRDECVSWNAFVKDQNE